MRWFHALVWRLLAEACLLWAAGMDSLARPLALTAMLVYLVFLGTMVMERRLHLSE